MSQHGLTLVELLIALVIFSIIVSIAIPQYSSLQQENAIYVTTHDFYQEIQLARSYAVSRNSRVTMKHKGTWSDGWDVYEDKNNNAQLDNDESVLWSNNGSDYVKIVSNRSVANYISFVSSGRTRLQSSNSAGAVQAGTFFICRPGHSNSTYQLTLSRGGRINILKIIENPCETM